MPKVPAAVAVAKNLRSHGRFEEALKWYESVFDPLKQINQSPLQLAILLEYVETLLEWGDKQAIVLADRILGPTPRTARTESTSTTMTVNKFQAMKSPLNPRILNLYHRLHIPHPVDRPSPYRFSSILPKAQEVTALVTSFGTALQAALERGDAEYLENVRALFDRQISTLAIEGAKIHYHESVFETQALQESLNDATQRLNYFQNLVNSGLNANENGFVACTATELVTLGAAAVCDGVSQALVVIPDVAVGAAGAFGSPLEVTNLPTGTKLSKNMGIAGMILAKTSQAFGTTANLSLMESQWDRRNDDWHQEIDSTTIEIREINDQIEASQKREEIAMNDLNTALHRRELSVEVEELMRDKFTAQDFQLFLQQETAILYRHAYNLAIGFAKEAQQLLHYELRVPCDFLHIKWNSLREGLMAGEKLQFALQQLQRTYMERNTREYEITKHFSLRTMLPAAFLNLKVFGFCEFDLKEWMFDLDYPGHYMRRIKTVSLTIPCVTGPYVNINCKLSLLQSKIRVQPLSGEIETHDPHFVCSYTATNSIATSSGQADSGMFTLDFNDERYFPFEYAGAISRWRIDLPPENNQFPIQTLTDVVLHLSYTAREGGEQLRRAAHNLSKRHLPADGWRLFDVRNEFSHAWDLFYKQHNLHLYLSRNMFPFIPGSHRITVVSLQLFIEAGRIEVGGSVKVNFQSQDTEKEFECVISDDYPNLYHGILDVKIGPIGETFNFGSLRFPDSLHHVNELYMLCKYEVDTGFGKQPQLHWIN
jgi:hypothetical protein